MGLRLDAETALIVVYIRSVQYQLPVCRNCLKRVLYFWVKQRLRSLPKVKRLSNGAIIQPLSILEATLISLHLLQALALLWPQLRMTG